MAFLFGHVIPLRQWLASFNSAWGPLFDGPEMEAEIARIAKLMEDVE